MVSAITNEVLRYIDHHLEEDLSLDQLASYTGYSTFHLHRAMKAVLTVPLGDYIRRKRIETAGMLLILTHYPISEIKYFVGYQNDAAFSKAFRQEMGCSPREFRKHRFFNLREAELPREYLSLSCKLVRLPDWKAVAFPAMIDYFHLESLRQQWDPVLKFLEDARTDETGLEFWGAFYECPNISGRTNCRYDAAVAPAGLRTPAGVVFNTRYAGGNYLAFRLCVPFGSIREVSQLITAKVLNHSSYEFREGFALMKYLLPPYAMKDDYLICEWYFPVR